MKRLIRNGKVLYQGELQELEVLFDENEIIDIAPHIEGDFETIDAEGNAVLPGLVDVHVHFREPGYSQKETLKTGAMAAASGGFTTVMPMPNLNPFPDCKENVLPYLKQICEDCVVHVLPYGTITCGEKGETVSDIHDMKECGIRWFSDDGVGVADDEVMKAALLEAKKENVLIACHTEDMRYRRKGASVHEGEITEKTGWIGIPGLCESVQLERDLKLAKETGAKYHGCHISAHESVDALRKAKAAGADVSAEVTAHHLILEENDVRGTMHKMNPPLRSHADRMCLIEALEDGTLDFIASDHAPHTISDKAKPMSEAAFGIVSLETSFALLYTEFVVRQKRWTLHQLIQWMSEKPAERFSLEKRGRIEKGWHSDLIIADLETERMIDANAFFSKGKNTPFHGWNVNATVTETIVDGRTVYRKGEFL